MRLLMLFVLVAFNVEGSFAFEDEEFSRPARIHDVGTFASKVIRSEGKLVLKGDEHIFADQYFRFSCKKDHNQLNMTATSAVDLVQKVTEEFCGPFKGDHINSKLIISQGGQGVQIKECPLEVQEVSVRYVVGRRVRTLKVDCHF